MLTKKQIKDLPKGDYPNSILAKMFPNQHMCKGKDWRKQYIQKYFK